MTAHKRDYYLREILFVTLLWLLGGLIFVYVKFNDIPDTAAKAYPVMQGMTKQWVYKFSVVTCLCIGLMMGIFHTLIYPKMIRTRNIVLTILLRMAIFATLTTAIILIFLHFSDIPSNTWQSSTLPRGSGMSVMVSMVLMDILVGLIVTLRTNLGKNYFRNFIRNPYFTPIPENRIFMFMNLRDSTILVKKMGSTHFSSFIQDCFKDLSSVSLELGGEVYQFVGDEAVITWRIKNQKQFKEAVDLHFFLIKQLEKKRGYYIRKHNHFPEFWSSIHSGTVSAALVGHYKKEIAFHGGVLNLCSRLQKVCRDYNANLVISENFYKQLPHKNSFRYTAISDIELKGISQKQLVYKVDLDIS